MTGTTPAPREVHEAAALAQWNAPGTQRLWRDHQKDTYIALMLARPDFCAMVDETYRIARAAFAAELEAELRRTVVAGWKAPFMAGQLPSAAAVLNWLLDIIRAAAHPTDQPGGNR